MSANELRQAAEKLRERAAAATPGPWVVSDHFHSDRERVYVVPTSPDVHNYVSAGGGVGDDLDADYIATVHPGVGDAIADLLDSLAFRMEQIEDAMPTGSTRKFAVSSAQVQGSMQALRIARLINGGAS